MPSNIFTILAASAINKDLGKVALASQALNVAQSFRKTSGDKDSAVLDSFSLNAERSDLQKLIVNALSVTSKNADNINKAIEDAKMNGAEEDSEEIFLLKERAKSVQSVLDLQDSIRDSDSTLNKFIRREDIDEDDIISWDLV